VHIAAGDLLRAEIATGSENGKRAKQYMEKGQLVPDEIAVMVCNLCNPILLFLFNSFLSSALSLTLHFLLLQMVKDRLLKPDSKERGWLLDGYPRSLSQATALKGFGFEPHTFLLLEVNILLFSFQRFYLSLPIFFLFINQLGDIRKMKPNEC